MKINKIKQSKFPSGVEKLKFFGGEKIHTGSRLSKTHFLMSQQNFEVWWTILIFSRHLLNKKRRHTNIPACTLIKTILLTKSYDRGGRGHNFLIAGQI